MLNFYFKGGKAFKFLIEYIKSLKFVGPAPKKKGLWLGDGLDGLDELDDSDLTDSDEEKEPEKEKAVAQK